MLVAAYRNGQYHGTSVCGSVHGPVGIVIVFCNFVNDEITDGHFEGVMMYAILLVDY